MLKSKWSFLDRNKIEAAAKEEEQRIIILDRELSQLKIQRSTEHSIYKDAIANLHNFRVQKMSRLNSISAVVTLFRDQIHSLDSNSTGITGGVEGTTSPGAEENEVKKKQSGAAAPSIGVISDMGSSSEQDGKKKASVHGNIPAKDDNVGAEDDALLVFSEDSLKTLQSRTEELKSERAMQKNKFRYLRFSLLNSYSSLKLPTIKSFHYTL